MSEEKDDSPDEVLANPDPHFEPLVHLPPVQTKTLEEDEEELLKLRAKLFRYDSAGEPREWKERGTGDVKILKHVQNGTCRLLMRRDKTLKICANHYVLPHLELKPNCGSDRAWVWSTPADFADEEPKPELLAIRFANAENAQKFRDVFDEAKVSMSKLSKKTSAEKCDKSNKNNDDEDKAPTTADSADQEKEECRQQDKECKKEKEEAERTDGVTEELEKLTVSGGDSVDTSEASS